MISSAAVSSTAQTAVVREFGMNRHQVKCHGDRITGGVISSRHQKAEEILEIGKRQALFSRNNTAQHTLRIYRLLTERTVSA